MCILCGKTAVSVYSNPLHPNVVNLSDLHSTSSLLPNEGRAFQWPSAKEAQMRCFFPRIAFPSHLDGRYNLTSPLTLRSAVSLIFGPQTRQCFGRHFRPVPVIQNELFPALPVNTTQLRDFITCLDCD